MYQSMDGSQPRSKTGFFVRGFFGLLVFGFLLATVLMAATLRTQVSTLDSNLSNKVDQILSGVNAMNQRNGPFSYAVPNVPPRKVQYQRGTCWDFSTISVLEHQYRLQGIEKGWLSADQYTGFSEQAYGNLILRFCEQHRDVCLTPNMAPAHNSTNGAEVTLLYEFRDLFKNSVLPVSVCPYIKKEDDSACAGIEDALASNPISFTVDSFTNIFDVEHIKQQLRSSGHALSISTPVHFTYYYSPCTEATASHPNCQPQSCMRCPLDKNFGATCCIRVEQPCYNMEGEFFRHHEIVIEGGHALTLVGYNDEWVTKTGRKGGFILRNTWADGVIEFGDEFSKEVKARGSHSIAYFMDQISELDERVICPNSENPRNWYTCSGVADCRSNDTIRSAYLTYSPIQLRCRNPTLGCKAGDNFSYYTLNVTASGDDEHVMCFLEYDETTHEHRDVCSTPMPIDTYALMFKPIPEQILPNSDDLCGFYMFPYDLARELRSQAGGFMVNDFHFTFHEQSYAANKNKYPQYKYNLVEGSTRSQAQLPFFPSPYPTGFRTTGRARSVLRKEKN